MPNIKENLLQCDVGSDGKDMSQVLGIREPKGLDFAEVVIVDNSACLDERQQAGNKKQRHTVHIQHREGSKDVRRETQ